MSDSIIIPLDFNETNEAVVRFADEWAIRNQQKIHFLHVINLSDRFYSDEIENIFETRNDEVIKDVERQLKEFVGKFEVKADHGFTIRVGKTYHEVVKLQETLEAKLICMSAHDRTKMERGLLGRNTDKVLHQAKCPIYVHKEHNRRFSKKILVPLGNISTYRVTGMDRAVVQLADEWASRIGAEIYFMHASRLVTSTYFPDVEHIYDSKMGREEAFDNLTGKLNDFIASFEIKSPYECVIRDGKPYHQIIDQQLALNAELIIMSAQDHNVFERMLMGSTTTYVTNNAKCPIYVMRG